MVLFTSPDNIQYPSYNDTVKPQSRDFALLAQTAQAAITKWANSTQAYIDKTLPSAGGNAIVGGDGSSNELFKSFTYSSTPVNGFAGEFKILGSASAGTAFIAVTPGSYTLSLSVMGEHTGGKFTTRLNFFDKDGGATGNTYYFSGQEAPIAWTTFTAPVTVPAGTTKAILTVWGNHSSGVVANDYLHITGVSLREVMTPDKWFTKISDSLALFSKDVHTDAWLANRLDNGTDLNAIPKAGVYNTWTDGSAATMTNTPRPKGGVLLYSTYGAGAGLQVYFTGSTVDFRMNGGGAWGQWQQVYPAGGGSASGATSASGLKLVPLALTLGAPDATGKTSATYRHPIQFNAPLVRWRLHVRNANPKSGVAHADAVSFSGLWLGTHAGDGAYASAPKQIVPAFTTAADGSEWVSPWLTDNIGDNQKLLLEYGYTVANAPFALAGGCYEVPANKAGDMAQSVTRSVTAPFDMWIEAETYAATPVVAVLGDSLSSGIGATLPVFDSMISQYMRAFGGLPVHYAASGDHMYSWGNDATYKITRWDSLARPDALIWALGSNDVFLGADLATLQSRFGQVLARMKSKVGAIYLASITPRTSVADGAAEQTRRSYNAWLKTQVPSVGRQLFDFVSPVSADDETLLPEFDSDGIHLKTAGYAAQARVVRPFVTAPAPVYQVPSEVV